MVDVLRKIRTVIPPQMPSYIPKTYLGMPPLPITTVEPFRAAGIRPTGGGKIKRDTTISGTGNGGFKLTTVKANSSGTGKANRFVSKSPAKAKSTKAKAAKKVKNSNKLVKKKGIFQKVMKSGKKAVSKYILGKGGRRLYRGPNGKFIKGGK